MTPTPNATELQALLERVEAASGPDMEIDAAVCAAFKYITGVMAHSWAENWTGPWEARGRQVHLLASDGRSNVNFTPATFTASLDAALVLAERVLPDTSVAVKRWASGTGDAEIGGAGVPDFARARAASPALAVVAAILKAMIATQGEMT